MTCYEIICLIIQTISFLILAIMVYSIKARERAAEEEAKRVDDYIFASSRYKSMEQVYKREAEMYSHWLCFALKYGCNSPEEMRSLIDDLVEQVKRLEVKR
jgi:hypothetical protein